MPVYPTLSAEEIRKLAASFGKTTTGPARLLSGGSANTNYLIQVNGKRYILSVCEAKPAAEVMILIQVLDHLHQAGFITSRTFPTTDGSPMILQKGKPVILKSYIEGRVPDRLTPEEACMLGKKMARLHTIPAPACIPDHHAYDPLLFSDLRSEAGDHPFVDWMEAIVDLIKASLPKKLSKGMIHGDIFCDNLVITAEQVTILDFEEVCNHYLMFDLGMAVVGTCCPGYQPRQEIIDQLLAGYQSASTLPGREIELLNLFAMYAATATAVWRFRQFNILTPYKELADNYQQMVKLAEIFRARW